MKSSILFFLIAMTIACNPNQKEASKNNSSNDFSQAISINPDEFINPPASAADWIADMQFIPLETVDDYFVPDDAIFKFRKELILVGNMDQLLIFDKSGKFLNAIRAKGGGPDEYRYIADFDLLPDKDEIVICGYEKMVFFSLEGDFIEKQDIPMVPMNIAPLGKDLFAFALGRHDRFRDESAGNFKLIKTDQSGSIVDRRFEYPYSLIHGGDPEFRIRQGSTGDWIFHTLPAIDALETVETLSPEQKIQLAKCKGFNDLQRIKEDDNTVVVMYQVK